MTNLIGCREMLGREDLCFDGVLTSEIIKDWIKTYEELIEEKKNDTVFISMEEAKMSEQLYKDMGR